jgi:cellulose biosynthesis protein BcsQ
MAEEFDTPDLRSAHVIVLGNEKGGTGKSTLSIHITIALLKAGYRVTSIDLDVRRRTLTRFLEKPPFLGADSALAGRTAVVLCARSRRLRQCARQ